MIHDLVFSMGGGGAMRVGLLSEASEPVTYTLMSSSHHGRREDDSLEDY